MPKICYIKKSFSGDSLAVIKLANQILSQYAQDGYDLTLRQLYYQFVARDLFPAERKWQWTGSRWVRDSDGTKNADPNYKWLGDIVNDARLAGLIDWDHITDRTRNMRQNAHWDGPADIIKACARQFEVDKWASQENYVEVWVEKDALVGVIEQACKPLDVPYFSCRGYTSQSEMWSAGQRLLTKHRAGKKVTIVHLGDHDPSGVDMSRDIEDRLNMFARHHVIRDHCDAHARGSEETHEEWTKRMAGDLEGKLQPITLDRIALTMEQIREYNPPPNPAKLTDARAKRYVEEYGNESWELDALEPAVLTTLITDAVLELRDEDTWERDKDMEDDHRARLGSCAKKWDELMEEGHI